MLSKIGISLALLLLVSCASEPTYTAPTYKDLIEANDKLKLETPEYIDYTVKGLASVRCDDGQCAMSEADFRQNQHDKKQLLNLHKASHQADVAIGRAYNSMVDMLTLEQMAANVQREESMLVRRALERERAGRLIRAWVERLGIAALLLVVGTL